MVGKIKKYDERGNLIYLKTQSGFEKWFKFDKNNNLIYLKDSNGYEACREFDKNNDEVYYKSSRGFEEWYRWEHKKQIKITKKEFEEIKRKEEFKEFFSRRKINKFEIIDI